MSDNRGKRVCPRCGGPVFYTGISAFGKFHCYWCGWTGRITGRAYKSPVVKSPFTVRLR